MQKFSGGKVLRRLCDQVTDSLVGHSSKKSIYWQYNKNQQYQQN